MGIGSKGGVVSKWEYVKGVRMKCPVVRFKVPQFRISVQRIAYRGEEGYILPNYALHASQQPTINREPLGLRQGAGLTT